MCAALLVACSPEQKPAAADDRTRFATQYAAAWSGKEPVRFGKMYEENGSLIVNGSASTGRTAIVETARSYMAAFPDMVVRLDSLREEPGVTVFHWTWTRCARRACPATLWPAVARKLTQLNRVRELRELAIPPENRLEALRGTRRGQHRIRINDQFRICFRWEDGYADDVEVTDYH